ncbi:MAG: septum formation protein Maf [Burkholderiaceae bacterium]|nr:MAG: septum formation protein Maf [Burkholderiaceae bacterium]
MSTSNATLPPLILASGSPYRRELLEHLRLPFTIVRPTVDETPRPEETAPELALRLALEKARTVAEQHRDALVIGSDQVLFHQGRTLGKPGTFEMALEQLLSMQGQVVHFHTALCLFDGRDQTHQLLDVPTVVRFRNLPRDELSRYLRAEQPYDCAGSAKCEGLGIALLDSIEGSDPNALIGLPLIALVSMLRHIGYPIL